MKLIEEIGDRLKTKFNAISNRIDALSSGSGNLPVGSGIWTFKDTPDTNFIFCQRQILSKTTYSALWTYAQSLPAAWFDNTGNDVTKFKDHDTNTFYMPDLRAISLVNSGTNSGYTKANGNYYSENLGSVTLDQIIGHRHSAPPGNNLYGTDAIGLSMWSSGGSGGSASTTGNPITDTVNGTPRVSDKINPFQVSMNFQIRYI